MRKTWCVSKKWDEPAIHHRNTREHWVQLSSLGVSMHPVSPLLLHSLRVINFPAPLWRDPFSVTIRNMHADCVYFIHAIITNKIVVAQLCTHSPCHIRTPLTLWVIDQSPFSIVTILKEIGMKFTNLSIEALCICTVNCFLHRLLDEIPCWAVSIVEMIDNIPMITAWWTVMLVQLRGN